MDDANENDQWSAGHPRPAKFSSAANKTSEDAHRSTHDSLH